MFTAIMTWLGISFVLMIGYFLGFVKGYNRGADDYEAPKKKK
jgi:ABC-type dipeptide/oligopeptide/nickel transport system permease subunit